MARSFDETKHPRHPRGSNRMQGMPVQDSTPQWQYVLTHEWGHAVDPFFSYPDAEELVEEHENAWTRGILANGDMSPYGQQNSAESYAEAFTEFYLSDGGTANNAALDYASLYDWRGRYGRFA